MRDVYFHVHFSAYVFFGALVQDYIFMYTFGYLCFWVLVFVFRPVSTQQG